MSVVMSHNDSEPSERRVAVRGFGGLDALLVAGGHLAQIFLGDVLPPLIGWISCGVAVGVTVWRRSAIGRRRSWPRDESPPVSVRQVSDAASAVVTRVMSGRLARRGAGGKP